MIEYKEYILRVPLVVEMERYKYISERATSFLGYPLLEEVVRCCDCRFSAGDEADQDGIDPYLCFVHEEYMAPDYFCADGERRVEQ